MMMQGNTQLQICILIKLYYLYYQKDSARNEITMVFCDQYGMDYLAFIQHDARVKFQSNVTCYTVLHGKPLIHVSDRIVNTCQTVQ
jgi:hypothetical protein